MTEQQNQSAVVEETREAVETTPQPENTEKKKAGNKTSLALSAIAIAIAIAAGIGLYRDKREDSLRKLDATQRNLDRVLDILEEIRPRLSSLERQAKRARDYHMVKRELDSVLRTWYGYHWRRALPSPTPPL